MLVFKSLLHYPKGTLESILTEAYSPFHERYPEYIEENLESFNECDTFFMKILKSVKAVALFPNMKVK